MTYAQQLRDYEQAVIQKRFEELQDDEVCGLKLDNICSIYMGNKFTNVLQHVTLYHCAIYISNYVLQ
jgi:Protein of unknown function (DUF3007)